MRESSLPPTLRPHLYHAPRHISSQGFAPLIVPDWPNQPTRSRSQDYGRSLPSPSHLLNQIQTQDHRTAIEQGHQDHRIVLDQGHQDHRIVLDQGHIEEPQRDLRPQVDSFPSQSIRGTCLIFSPQPPPFCVRNSCAGSCVFSPCSTFSLFQMRSRCACGEEGVWNPDGGRWEYEREHRPDDLNEKKAFNQGGGRLSILSRWALWSPLNVRVRKSDRAANWNLYSRLYCDIESFLFSYCVGH